MLCFAFFEFESCVFCCVRCHVGRMIIREWKQLIYLFPEHLYCKNHRMKKKIWHQLYFNSGDLISIMYVTKTPFHLRLSHFYRFFRCVHEWPGWQQEKRIGKCQVFQVWFPSVKDVYHSPTISRHSEEKNVMIGPMMLPF